MRRKSTTITSPGRLGPHALWKVRNTALHGETFTESEATRRTRIEPLVRRLYGRIYELPPTGDDLQLVHSTLTQ